MIVMTDQDREYVLKNLDREHINEIAWKTRQALANGAVEMCYQPGDATWYSLTLTSVPVLVGAGGGGTGGYAPSSFIGGVGFGRYLIVYAQREKAVWFEYGDDLEWVALKLSDNEASALAIAELLKAIFQ